MQILHIVGNGFDLNLGLKTSYKDFYEYYNSIQSDNIVVQKLKDNISDEYDSWSDLELALGSYTQYVNKVEDFDDILNDIGEKLSEYLQLEENKLENFEINHNKFISYLISPENSFLPADREQLTSIKNKWSSHEWQINIFTFNYTSIIERFLGDSVKGAVLEIRRNNLPIRLGEMKHIHGFLDRDMVLGVNDISQIKNEVYYTNRDVLESIVKSECNQANKNNVDRQFTEKIKLANLICIYGSSIGDTDKKWWELIGERLKDDCYLIIFSKGAEISPRIRYKQARTERAIKKLFLSKTKLSDKEIEMVEDRIFIGINTGMFGGLIKQVG